MARKGISPLIAAVLLIAFTMAVASLFAQWAPQLVQDAQSDTSEQAQAISDNSDLALEISETNKPNVTIQQVAGDSPAGDVTVTWYGDSGTQQKDYTGTGGLDSDTRGILDATLEPSDNNIGTLDRVEADPSVDLQGAPTATYDFN